MVKLLRRCDGNLFFLRGHHRVQWVFNGFPLNAFSQANHLVRWFSKNSILIVCDCQRPHPPIYCMPINLKGELVKNYLADLDIMDLLPMWLRRGWRMTNWRGGVVGGRGWFILLDHKCHNSWLIFLDLTWVYCWFSYMCFVFVDTLWPCLGRHLIIIIPPSNTATNPPVISFPWRR